MPMPVAASLMWAGTWDRPREQLRTMGSREYRARPTMAVGEPGSRTTIMRPSRARAGMVWIRSTTHRMTLPARGHR